MAEKISRSVGVHDGPFHADEVSACALLLLFDCVDRDKVLRTRDPKKLASCEFVCDVGGIYDPAHKLFDHHQVSYQGSMSSAGMILLYLRDAGVIDQERFDYFNGMIILGVDAHDNGRSKTEYGHCSFSHVIANFAPPAYDAPLEEAFADALEFALGHLRRLQSRYLYNVECRAVVKAAMEADQVCLHFDRAIPWLESFFALGGEDHPAKFLIMPAREHWKLRAIPPSYDRRMQVRKPLPAAWAGLLDEDLRRASGIEGAVFCHKGRFTSVWETKEAALKALEATLNENSV